MEKYAGPWVTGDKSPSILLGRSFQVLVSETSVFEVFPGKLTDGENCLELGSWHRFHRADDKMQFFTRNKTLQDSGDVTGNPT